MEDDGEYSDCEIIQDDKFSLEEAVRYPPPVPPQEQQQMVELPMYMGQNNSEESKPNETVKEPKKPRKPKEMKGTVLKKKGGEWKDRYLHVRPNVRALFYYEKLAKAQKNCKPLGVYPLLGAIVSELRPEPNDSFSFTLELRTGQKIEFKLLDRKSASEWRSALRDTAQQPCTAPSEGVEKGECVLKRLPTNQKRTIELDYSSGYFYACKKNDSISPPLEQHALKQSTVIPQKSFDANYDVIIKTEKDYKKLYSFKTPEEWAKWCAELEAVILREKQAKQNA